MIAASHSEFKPKLFPKNHKKYRLFQPANKELTLEPMIGLFRIKREFGLDAIRV